MYLSVLHNTFITDNVLDTKSVGKAETKRVGIGGAQQIGQNGMRVMPERMPLRTTVTIVSEAISCPAPICENHT